MISDETADPDDFSVALMALSWILQDQVLTDRFIALTGLMPDDLRGSLAEPATQGAILDFLAGNDGDLMAAADGMGVRPERIVAARDALTGSNAGRGWEA
ncbi:MAG TPA: DUF3572 domain-containing protein [Croceicoccus sp.]|nr:DUF3572 domain-containing protein [Croceicoccus sp.]